MITDCRRPPGVGYSFAKDLFKMCISLVICLFFCCINKCSNVYVYGTGREQCRFVTVTTDCTADVKFLNYMDFVFCKTGGRFKPIGTIICVSKLIEGNNLWVLLKH